MKRVALYYRVSTIDQSLDMQVNELGKYVASRGWSIVGDYSDTISAAKKRPGLDRLKVDAKKRKFDIGLVWRYDRLARSLVDLIHTLETFNMLGIDFISHQEAIDTSTAMGKLIFSVTASFAEFERNLIQSRVQAGVDNKRSKMGTGETWGRQPINQELIKQVRALKLYGLSIRAIARELGLGVATVHKYLNSA